MKNGLMASDTDIAGAWDVGVSLLLQLVVRRDGSCFVEFGVVGGAPITPHYVPYDIGKVAFFRGCPRYSKQRKIRRKIRTPIEDTDTHLFAKHSAR